MCKRTLELAEDITDRWTNSIPFVGSNVVLATAPKVCTQTPTFLACYIFLYFVILLY